MPKTVDPNWISSPRENALLSMFVTVDLSYRGLRVYGGLSNQLILITDTMWTERNSEVSVFVRGWREWYGGFVANQIFPRDILFLLLYVDKPNCLLDRTPRNLKSGLRRLS
ncbi:hypothetical protein KC19_VG154200 [Ceratodon purpureus]|uniref:Uncharacterized protein n=1 Tax=Ceratodon purpureus TaxID=3225 RepID=A0A8T0HQW6_CERPU|nr:hypothetical protein KC19_VG154200 [Ceratodon purpureus]